MVHTLGILALEGSTMYELAVPYEVFGVNRPDLSSHWYASRFVLAAENVFSPFILEKPADLHDMGNFDTLIVPPTRPLDGEFSQVLLDGIRDAHARGTRIVSLCTGAFVVATTGILDGRVATTHWMYSAQFRARFPRVRLEPDVLYVDNEDVLTSAGKSAALDLCLYLVKKDHGPAVSNELARRLVTPPHRVGGQAQYMNRTTVRGPVPALLEALAAWIEERLEFQISVEDVAAQAHLSTRQLSRLFKAHYELAPREWIEQQRIFRAQRYLETTDHTVSRIAAEAGFGSYASLRRAFQRNVGLAPEAYRKTFFGIEESGQEIDALGATESEHRK